MTKVRAKKKGALCWGKEGGVGLVIQTGALHQGKKKFEERGKKKRNSVLGGGRDERGNGWAKGGWGKGGGKPERRWKKKKMGCWALEGGRKE